MDHERVCRDLVRLAGRVDRLRPDRRDPERFFVDRDEIRCELEKLAGELSPSAIKRSNPRVPFVAGDVFLRGRVIKVGTRNPSARGKTRRSTIHFVIANAART